MWFISLINKITVKNLISLRKYILDNITVICSVIKKYLKTQNTQLIYYKINKKIYIYNQYLMLD